MSASIIKSGSVLFATIVMGCGPTPSQTATAATSPQQMQGQPGGESTEIALWPQGLAITKPELIEPYKDGTEKRGRVDKPVAGRPGTYVGNAWRPTMTIYPPKVQNTHAALMVYPGGGYQALAIDLEGTEICDWATARGMTCVLLKYRVPQTWWHKDCGDGHRCERQPKPFLPLQDAQRALGLLRQRAAGLGVDPHKIGVIGFSAGGHLVTAISNATGRSYTPVDAADTLSARPDFAMPLYPGHLWTGGQDTELFPFDPVRADCPPTFMVQAEDDPVDDVRNSISYFMALRAVKVPVEMHIFAHGGHAFGARPTDQPITHWPALAETWLHTIHIL